MSRRSLLQIPPGVQCFYDREARLRRAIERRVAEVFEGWSYEEVLLPLFDYFEVFARAGGEAFAPRIYRFIGRDGEVLALRPDFTALVAKVAASRLAERPLPLRLFYSGEVLRYEPPQAGSQGELYQIGLEHIGDGLGSDLEVLAVALEALERLSIQDALLTVGHAGFISGLLAETGVEASLAAECFEALRRRDGARLEGILGARLSSRLNEATALSGGVEVLARARRLTEHLEALAALDHLEQVGRELDRLGLLGRVTMDLGVVRGLAYYTGIVFEMHAPGSGLELGGGGRYDRLLANFGWPAPAVGFSLSLDRLAQLLLPSSSDLERREPSRPVKELSAAVALRRKGVTVKRE